MSKQIAKVEVSERFLDNLYGTIEVYKETVKAQGEKIAELRMIIDSQRELINKLRS